MKIQDIFFNNGFTGIQFVPVDVDNDGVRLNNYAFMNVVAHYDLLEPVKSRAEDFSDELGGYTRVRDELIDKEKLDKIFERL